MTIGKPSLAALVVLALLAQVGGARAAFSDTDRDREDRWQALAAQLFGNILPRRDEAAVNLEAPARALDAALVPITIRLAHPETVRGLYLIVDDNPSPVAAHFDFGPDIDPRVIRLRVRINTYTDVHAVAELKDGTRVMTSSFVKASGGCSAPMGINDGEAMRGMGEMKVKVAGDFAAGKPIETRLMIRHPNFNGMQMNDVTRDYTPARYIQTIDVVFDDRLVFAAATDISIASNPVISFDLRPHSNQGLLKVDVKDSQNDRWSKRFPLPAIGN